MIDIIFFLFLLNRQLYIICLTTWFYTRAIRPLCLRTDSQHGVSRHRLSAHRQLQLLKLWLLYVQSFIA